MAKGLFTGEEINTKVQDREWQDMPEFTQEKQSSFHSIIIHFRNREDIQEFAKLINQNLTPETKSIYYPKLKYTTIMGKQYIDTE